MSVRKAFLDIDMNHDGKINAEDILKFFGQNDSKFSYKDLHMLLKHKDTKKKGILNYNEFSNWLGKSITPCEGFYFRHDSV